MKWEFKSDLGRKVFVSGGGDGDGHVDFTIVSLTVLSRVAAD